MQELLSLPSRFVVLILYSVALLFPVNESDQVNGFLAKNGIFRHFFDQLFQSKCQFIGFFFNFSVVRS